MAGSTHTFEENQAAATDHLRRFAEQPLLHLIAGHHVASASGETFANQSPIDGMHLGEVASGDAADIDAAAEAATAAFAEWGNTPGAERKRILHKVADTAGVHTGGARVGCAAFFWVRRVLWLRPLRSRPSGASLRCRASSAAPRPGGRHGKNRARSAIASVVSFSKTLLKRVFAPRVRGTKARDAPASLTSAFDLKTEGQVT